MELALALIIFAAMIVVWLMLPGTVSAEETQVRTTATESMPMAPAKA